MIGTCYRIQRNSFTDELLLKELREKTREWQECLKYTPKFILSTIKYLANKHVEGVWTQAHKALLGDSVWWLLHKPGVIDLRKRVHLSTCPSANFELGVQVTPPHENNETHWWKNLKGGGVSISPPPLVVDYGWWAIWTTICNLLSMHKTHAVNLVTVQTRVPSRHKLVMGWTLLKL